MLAEKEMLELRLKLELGLTCFAQSIIRTDLLLADSAGLLIQQAPWSGLRVLYGGFGSHGGLSEPKENSLLPSKSMHASDVLRRGQPLHL